MPHLTRLYRLTGTTRRGPHGGVVLETEPTALWLTDTGARVTDEDGILTRVRLVWRR